MRVFVQQPFKAWRQSVYGVVDAISVSDFVSLLIESARISDIHQEDLLIMEGAEEVIPGHALSEYLCTDESMLPNQLYLMVRSRAACITPNEATTMDICHSPASGEIDVMPFTRSITFQLPPMAHSPTVEVVGPCHAIVSGTVNLDAETGVLSFTPTFLLDPATRHCVYIAFVDGNNRPRGYQWAFKTRSLPPCRVIMEQCAPASDPPRVVELSRHDRCLFTQLRLQIASRLWGASVGPYDWTRVSIEAIDGREVNGRSAFERDAAVCLLDGKVLARVTYTISESIREEDLHLTPDKPSMSYEEYTQAHWAHPQAGYLAIGGKLSEREEAELLCMVVRAFADPQDLVDADSEEESAAVPVCPPFTPPESGAQDCHARPWAEQRVFRTADLGTEAVETLKARGYVLMSLDEEVAQRIQALYSSMETFFNLPTSRKMACHDEAYKYLGYRDNVDRAKEMFQFRRSVGGSPGIFAPTRPDFRESVESVFTDLAGISASLLSHVCASVGMSPGRVQLLCESPSQAPSSGAYSMSNLTLFHYAAQRAVDRDGDQAEAVPIAAEVPCPTHTDIGLLTIIPVSRGTPALRLFDWQDKRWVDVETEAPPCSAVIFAGETLARLTNAQFRPALHEVVVPYGESPRLSCPLQLLADANAWLDYADLDSSLVGPCVPGCRQAMRADRFVFGLSRMRQSTTYNR